MSVEEAIEYLKHRKLKTEATMKVLLKTHVSPHQQVEVVDYLTAWSTQTDLSEEITSLSSKLITYLRMFQV